MTSLTLLTWFNSLSRQKSHCADCDPSKIQISDFCRTVGLDAGWNRVGDQVARLVMAVRRLGGEKVGAYSCF